MWRRIGNQIMEINCIEVVYAIGADLFYNFSVHNIYATIIDTKIKFGSAQ